MTAPRPETERSQDEPERLVSWKGIAAFFERDERTVKRWERDRGLPVHRVPGGERGGVFAYPSELKDWLHSHQHASETDEQPANSSMAEPAPAPREPQPVAPESAAGTQVRHSASIRNWLIAACALLAVGLGATVAMSGAVRVTGQQFARSLPAVFSMLHHPSSSPTTIAVSGSERALAHALYLKGRFEWNQRTPESLNSALDYFTQAVVHDPGNAAAYAGLADTYDLLREFSTLPDKDAYQRAMAAAKKAVELDDSLSQAHRALAFAEYYGNWDFIDGEKEFRRAIELNPNDPITRKWYANAIKLQGRFQESLAEISKAQELDPTSLSLMADKGALLVDSGQRTEGLDLLKEVERASPSFASPHLYLMSFYLSSQDYVDYLDEGDKLASARDDLAMKDIFTSARAGFKRQGARGLLQRLYEKQELYHREGNVSATDLAVTCDKLGKEREALQLIQEAFAQHEPEIIITRFEKLTNDPTYRELRSSLHFPDVAQSPIERSQ